MADPSAGASTPAIPQSDLEAVEEIAAVVNRAESIYHDLAESQLRNADNVIAACEEAIPIIDAADVTSAGQIGEIAGAMREIDALRDRVAKAAESLELVRAAHVRAVTRAMKTAGLDSIRAGGFLFTFNRRNDMAIADLAAAVDHAGRLGMAERIYSPIKVDRTLVLKLARDLEATDVQLEGCARVPSVTFSVKETE